MNKIRTLLKDPEFIGSLVMGLLGLAILIGLKIAGTSIEEVVDQEALGVPVIFFMK